MSSINETFNYNSSFLKEIYQRGFIKQCTNSQELDKKMLQSSINGYVGFDCTAQSFHVGNLMQIMLMRNFQKHGHRPIILLGGATTRIGDPSDKDEERKILSIEEIEENKNSLSKTFTRFLDCSEAAKAKNIDPIFVDNYDWLSDIKYLDFLRDYGRYFSINRMLTFESVKRRLDREQSLSFLEFNYTILQAYDFMELNKKHNCILQFGGSEQWGNIVSGIELSHKILQKELFGITTHLITTSSGKKMGKTAQGAVWLNSSLLSPYDYWQFWRNTDDQDVIRFLLIYTDLSIEKIEEEKRNNKNINDLKILLANEATKICHGEEEAKKSEATAHQIFVNGGLSEDMPRLKINSSDLKDNIHLYKFMTLLKISESGNTAKNLINGRAVKINDIVFDDPLYEININLFTKNNLLEEKNIKISVGKKKHYIITLN